MFGWFKKKDGDSVDTSDPRAPFLVEFSKRLAEASGGDQVARMSVGYVINSLNTAFITTFNSYEEYQARPQAEKMEYIKKLIAFGTAMAAAGRKPETLAAELFSASLTPLAANDMALFEAMRAALSDISKEGDPELIARRRFVELQGGLPGPSAS